MELFGFKSKINTHLIQKIDGAASFCNGHYPNYSEQVIIEEKVISTYLNSWFR